ncbi:MAG: hypothetical protein GX974_08015 [Clostridiales bacterium]|nr:hypothetical protein [Clostridiales bacterium]
MGIDDMLKTFKSKIKGIKSYELIITILVMTIVISIYISSLKSPAKIEGEQIKDIDADNGNINISSSQKYEQRLAKILSGIKGAGKVDVMITYHSGKELVTAKNTVETNVITEEEDSGGGTRAVTQSDLNSQAVIMSGSDGTKPLIIKEVEPEIKGVIVIAQGAYDINVKLELLRAVQIALGVNPNQVEVFIMDENLNRGE